MRRVVLAVAVGASLLAIALVGVLAFRSDEVSEVRERPTTTTGPGPAPGSRQPGTTTTAKGAPVESGGAAPVAGSILSIVVDDPGKPVDVGEETDCGALDESLTPVACTRLAGSGGGFLVFVGRGDDGGIQIRLYRATAPGKAVFTLVRRSQVFPRNGDVVGVALGESDAGGEPVIVVDYDFDGSGAVHSFDVVAWDSSEVDPRVVAFVNGTGGDRFVARGGVLEFVGANYDDGAPTCCPNVADVRTLRHDGPGRWAITERTVPFSEAP